MTDQEYFDESMGSCDCPGVLREGPKTRSGWLCTRPKDHSGLHVACGSHGVCARWSTDYQPIPTLLLP